MTKKIAYHIRSQDARFRKRVRRELKKAQRKAGFYRFYFDIIRKAHEKGYYPKAAYLPSYISFGEISVPQRPEIPDWSDTIKFLASNREAFDRSSAVTPTDGVFKVPSPFSLTDNYSESFTFLKKLFYSLYRENLKDIYIDYRDCERIDLDASVCMDVLLDEFITRIRLLRSRGLPSKIKRIIPINFEKQSIKKILFSIGAFTNIAKIQVPHASIIPFNLIKGDNFSSAKGRSLELELTHMVDYILLCLKRMNKSLTWEAENQLSKVCGEILINASEHSGQQYRYAIGYFEDLTGETDHLGIFNLVIFSFGKTIYQNFKNAGPESWHVVSKMKELSEQYTQRSLFRQRQFEEETLWTLYALQEGVTSVANMRRGNGSIQFIESFFSLKGNMSQDNLSFLTIMSGNARVTFDGKYDIIEKPRGDQGKHYKMMTFNDSGEISDLPDSKYVSFAENFFPGTLMTAKICINFNSIQNSPNGQPHN